MQSKSAVLIVEGVVTKRKCITERYKEFYPNRGVSKVIIQTQKQIMLSLMLGILFCGQSMSAQLVLQEARQDWRKTTSEIREADIKIYLERLASPEMQGRATGTPGEKLATDYVAELFREMNLLPAGEKETFFQPFEFTAGVDLGSNNSLTALWEGQKTRNYELHKDWRPLAFSGNGAMNSAELVFAGYGLSAPADEKHPAYDSYQGLDVKEKWVLIFRYIPENVSQEKRQHFQRFASLAYKAAAARSQGARGIVVVSGPNSKVKEQLVKLQFEGSPVSSSLGALSITDSLAEEWLSAEGKNLKALQDELDSGRVVAGLPIKKVRLEAQVDIKKVKQWGRNVVGRLSAGGPSLPGMVLLGAHLDHLGRGEGNNSLARPEEKGQIHFGADDNASGVAGLLELAQYFTSLKKTHPAELKRDLVFAAWSGEELGLLGSNHFATTFGGGVERPQLTPDIMAYVNLDMIGRLDQKLIIQGIGSSNSWKKLVESRNGDLQIPLTLQNDSYLPTDATSFYLKQVPILSLFTGAHEDYHTPRDTPDRINLAGEVRIVRLVAGIMESLETSSQALDYQEMKKPENLQARAGMRIYLGTIPDFSKPDVVGVPLAGASKGGPADKAGVQKGDIVIELAGKKIENIYDYTHAMGLLKIGEPALLVVQRGSEKIQLSIVPGTRE